MFKRFCCEFVDCNGNDDEFRESAVNYFEEFSDKTTIHGVRYLGERRRPNVEKVWWIIVFIISICVCGKLIKEIYQKWEDFPVIVTFGEQPTPVWEIPFPAVTICPDIKTQGSVFNFTKMYLATRESNFSDQSMAHPTNVRYLEALSQVCFPNLNVTTGLFTNLTDNLNETELIETFRELAPPQSNVLLYCQFRNEPIPCNELFNEVVTELGICYNLNLLDSKDLFRADAVLEFQHKPSDVRRAKHWSIDSGYDENAERNSYPLRATQTGLEGNLEMYMGVRSSDIDYMCRGPTPGFRVHLHSPASMPQMTNKYVFMSLEQNVFVEIQPNMMTTSPRLKSYKPERRQCYYQNERYLRFFHVYTRENCELECLSNFTQTKCGCVKFSMPHDNDDKMCGSDETACYTQATFEFEEMIFQGNLNEFLRSCKCLPGCTSLNYRTLISQSKLEPHASLNFIKKMGLDKMDMNSSNMDPSIYVPGDQTSETQSTLYLPVSTVNVMKSSSPCNFSTYCIEDSTSNCNDEIILNGEVGDIISFAGYNDVGVINNCSDLQALLLSWKVDCLLNDFIKEQIFINIMKIMNISHVQPILKHHPIGTQVLFEYNFEKWRSDIGQPVVNCTHIARRISPQTNKQPDETAPLPRHSPKPESEAACQITLAQILNETGKGSMVVHYYEKIGRLHEEQRNILINLICQYFFERNVHISLVTSKRLETEICERFPTEKNEFYRAGKRGKIYNKSCNLKSGFKPILLPPEKEVETSKEIVPEPDAECCERSLKYDKLTVEEFDRTWVACGNYRLKDITNMKEISGILTKWPFYKQPSGFRLIDMDFNLLFPKNTTILDKWDKYGERIQTFICNDGTIKDKSINAVLAQFKQPSDISENSRNAIILWSLHGYLVPTQKTVTKNNAGKKSTTKHTIRDGQDSFLFIGKSFQQIEDHVAFLVGKGTNIQPLLFAVGDSICDLREIYVYFDGVKFCFTNTLRAVDICFKIFHLFNLEYPLAATNFYIFIQELFYGIKYTKAKNTKINILLNEITTE